MGIFHFLKAASFHPLSSCSSVLSLQTPVSAIVYESKQHNSNQMFSWLHHPRLVRASHRVREHSWEGGNLDFSFEAGPSFLWVLLPSQAQLESTSSQKFHPDMRAARAAASSLLVRVSHKQILRHTAAVRSVLESDYRIETCLQHFFLFRLTEVALMWLSCHPHCAVIPAVILCCRRFRLVSFHRDNHWVN